MCDTVKPELLTVTTVDAFHAEYIVKALDRGIDVITEKPMVIDETQCKAVLDAETRNKRKIVVGFNYRFAPKHVKIKEILQAGEIGTGPVGRLPLVSRHHARRRLLPALAPPEGEERLAVGPQGDAPLRSDQLVARRPTRCEVQAYGELKHYGKAGPVPHRPTAGRARTRASASSTGTSPRGAACALHARPSRCDGYLRDGCVFREDIDIWDTMTATIKYSNDVLMSYSLNTFMPIEGYAPGLQRRPTAGSRSATTSASRGRWPRRPRSG